VQKAEWPSPQGAKLLAASPEGVWQRFDSMAVDIFGNLYVATLIRGGISIFSPNGHMFSHFSIPDPITTNLCFGGAERRTLYVTLSGLGQLVAIDDWPIPGLPMQYQI
jgi:gluconolactonase